MSEHTRRPRPGDDERNRPTHSRVDEEFRFVRLEDGHLLLYDRDNLDAWIETDAAIDLTRVG